MAEQTNNNGIGCGGRLINLIAAFVALLAIAGVAFAVLMLVAPDALAQTPLAGLLAAPTGSQDESGALPTSAAVAALPTARPTTAESLLKPTWTPAATDVPPTPAPTNTRRPTLTPSATPIFPTDTPTPTPTNTPTATPTETPIGPTPTPSPTRSQFPFTRSDVSPIYLQNYANTAGCDWMGIAGEVLDLNRNPVPRGQYRVHVWGSGIDARVNVGDAPDYSPSGYEQFLFNSPVVRDYNVQLETVNGTAVSQVYNVQTRASCNQNLVRFDFVQNHS